MCSRFRIGRRCKERSYWLVSKKRPFACNCNTLGWSIFLRGMERLLLDLFVEGKGDVISWQALSRMDFVIVEKCLTFERRKCPLLWFGAEDQKHSLLITFIPNLNTSGNYVYLMDGRWIRWVCEGRRLNFRMFSSRI